MQLDALLDPSPKPTFCPKWEVSVNVGLEEGQVGRFPETYDDPFIPGGLIIHLTFKD